MNIHKIPEGCFNDPQFVKNFISTMCKEISKKEEIHSDGERIINKIKETLTRGLEQRRPMKPMIQMEKEKKSLLEPILQSSNAAEIQLSTQLAIISARLDEKSLRDKTYLERYSDIVEMYRTTWVTRQSEYEKLPAAVERYKRKTGFRLLDIELMMCKQKEKEYGKMIRNKEKINAMRLTRKTVEMVKMLQDRWNKQRTKEDLTKNCIQLKRQLEAIIEEKIKLSKLKEEEERSKLRAKQLMPPPKLDLNFIKSFYVTGKSHREREIEKKRAIRFSNDSDDNVSITTEIIEDMCRGPNDIMEVTGETDDEEIESLPRSISGLLMRHNHQKKSENNNSNKGIEVLEKTYRQLSLEKDDNHPDNSPIEVQVVFENSEKTSPQKLQSILRKSMNKSEDSPGVKRSRLEQISVINEEEDTEKSRQIQENKSEQLPKKDAPVKKNRQLPQIQSIETINRPIQAVAKPLVAEIPPRPSNLFSPRHYTTSSFGSIDNFESTFNQDFDGISETETPLNSKLDMNFTGQISWANFSPPSNPLQSDTSFTSNISAFKNPDADNEVQKSHQQTNNEDSNFAVIFQAGTSTKSFFS